MAYDTIFYICGGALALLAVTTSFIGLKSEKFPGKGTPVIILVFVALIGVTATYAVLNGKEEAEARAHELEEAGQEFEEAEEDPTSGGEAAAPTGSGESKTPVNGPGGTLKLAASPTDLAYDTTELTSKPGEVTIDFTNPAAFDHDVAIEKDGTEIAGSDLVAEGETSVTADLGPGDYTFLCTVPGHAEAGMEGTLKVQ